MDGLFAGTPPLEALRALIGEAATMDTEEAKVIEVDDVLRAFFEADMQRDICIELPLEDLEKGESNEEFVGYLLKSLYGTRDAATNWHCLLYTSPSPRDLSTSRMPSSA